MFSKLFFLGGWTCFVQALKMGVGNSKFRTIIIGIAWKSNRLLGGGFKYFLFSPLLGEDSHFD